MLLSIEALERLCIVQSYDNYHTIARSFNADCVIVNRISVIVNELVYHCITHRNYEDFCKIIRRYAYSTVVSIENHEAQLKRMHSRIELIDRCKSIIDVLLMLDNFKYSINKYELLITRTKIVYPLTKQDYEFLYTVELVCMNISSSFIICKRMFSAEDAYFDMLIDGIDRILLYYCNCLVYEPEQCLDVSLLEAVNYVSSMQCRKK